MAGHPEGHRRPFRTGSVASRFAYVVLVPHGQWWTATLCAAPVEDEEEFEEHRVR